MHIRCVLEVPNDLQAIEGTVEYLMGRGREAGFHADRLRLNLRVGLTEALSNAMLYGNRRDPGKTVRVDADLSAARVRIRVTDEGGGFDPDVVPDPTLPAHRERPGGRGLYLIRQLMDEVEFNESGNSIVMILHGEAGA
jgi:serine/threonine-protein kinase RsbW